MSSACKLITIFLSQENETIKLNINSDTKAGDVSDILLQRDAYLTSNKGFTYSIALGDDPSVVFSPDTRLCKVPSDNFVFRVTLANIHVKLFATRRETFFGLDPLLTVKDTAVFVEYRKFVACDYSIQTRPPTDNLTPEHDIYLITNTSLEHIPKNGIRMEYDRSLASYRLKPHDILLFVQAKSNSKIWTDMAGATDQLAVIINSPEFSLKKAFKFSRSTNFDTVIVHFLEKANVKESKWFYALYLDVAGEEQEMQHNWLLSDFPLPSPARLELRKKPRKPMKWFGTDPSTLPMLVDPQNGIEVPEILVMLKDILVVMGGIESEGIFRKAGLESEMVTLKEKIENGEPFHSYNPHSIATLMKRWYKQLPERLLVNVDHSISDSEILLLDNHLSDINARLFNWLICLLLLVVDKEEENKMDPKNCAIVWGPGMIGSSQDTAATTFGSPMEDFEETRFGINAVQYNVATHKKAGTKPRGAHTPVAAPVIEHTIPQHRPQIVTAINTPPTTPQRTGAPPATPPKPAQPVVIPGGFSNMMAELQFKQQQKAGISPSNDTTPTQSLRPVPSAKSPRPHSVGANVGLGMVKNMNQPPSIPPPQPPSQSNSPPEIPPKPAELSLRTTEDSTQKKRPKSISLFSKKKLR